MPRYEVIRKRLNRLTQQPETVTEIYDDATVCVFDGALMVDAMAGDVLLAVPGGIWLEARQIDAEGEDIR